ncbi:MAG TPA: NADH-ubiquinone oxidoreductase-F iron-sulfur binding region domain-containing protein [Candidatus Limnocylindrales bacterium]|nr:NADH-ubiquinone oxidoreductase-F iron-sulfur binding region domain-containing protein [Candidatus Limnocylindrales bacterium]
MKTLTDKCCSKCWDSELQRCPVFTECQPQRPLSHCHTDEACIRQREEVVTRLRYGAGTLIRVGVGTCGQQAGASSVLGAIFIELQRRNLSHVSLSITGCLGNCFQEVVVSISHPKYPTVLYTQVSEDRVPYLISEHIEKKRIARDLVLAQLEEPGKKPLGHVPVFKNLDFFRKQIWRVSERCGHMDPESLDDFLLHGGFLGLSKTIREAKPPDLLKLLKESKLKGRGGSGEDVADKWARVAAADGEEKYIICNAHEGDPASFKDRRLLESDPLGVIEAMTLAGYTVGAGKGIIFLNPRYELAKKRLELALTKARAFNYLGKEILGSNFSFDIEIRLSPGDYLSGEETSLVTFLEGKAGVRRVPPPLTSQGLWNLPTLIHNVETLLNIPLLVVKGVDWFREQGTGNSPGTRCWTLSGCLQRRGIVEAPVGISIQDLLDMGGGALPGKKIKAVHVGGYVGGYLPESLFQTPLDDVSLKKSGISLGIGSLVALEETTCMVHKTWQDALFTAKEECGQCTPGREGSYQISRFLEKICRGRGVRSDLQKLKEIAFYMREASMCAYGRFSPGLISSSLEYFHSEYEEHLQKHCPAGVCFK